jgi:peroxiredoxin Q/BCP
VQKREGQLLAVSMDDRDTLVRFKTELKAPFPFVPDPEGKLVKLFDVKMPVMAVANRTTFVIGEGRKVLQVESGKDAVDPSGAIAACPLRKPSSSP